MGSVLDADASDTDVDSPRHRNPCTGIARKSPESFVARADAALYEAKHAGRDRDGLLPESRPLLLNE
jgi:hypothetical protein